MIDVQFYLVVIGCTLMVIAAVSWVLFKKNPHALGGFLSFENWSYTSDLDRSVKHVLNTQKIKKTGLNQ